jgi:transcriptional regulator with GAF, ATPase, and Fis domain/CHASE2 domain-containing sensor protein
VSIIVIGYLILLLFPGIKNGITKGFENIYKITRGEVEPDSNIVLIHISKEDLESIGPWPIKRNYYALLINELTKLNVKQIGLEVFISSRLVTQTIYDKLLKNEIDKSGRVVLSSIAGMLIQAGEKFYTDSLSYPSPKLLNENFSTGHLNYIENDGIVIPIKIYNKDFEEAAFSKQLAGSNSNLREIQLNVVASWRKIQNYSVLEFSKMIYNNDETLSSFNNKIILIGISDEQFASTIKTTFDNQLPGVALHAFAIDNILNSRHYRSGLYLISAIVFFILLVGLNLFSGNSSYKLFFIYLFIGIAFLVITFVLYSFFYQKLALAFFAVPFLLLIVSDVSSHFLEREKLLEGVLDESDLLKSLLNKKEIELVHLQNKLSTIKEEGETQLVEKIKTLESDIAKLKENEDDREKVKVEETQQVENFWGIVYKSKAMASVVELIKKSAPTDTTILIVGESGTGKELVARAIHSLSSRNNKNFVAVNCGALSENILESELFGHVRGAFTGASTDKLGRFEVANNGSIFLDEIGETSESFQVKLLRVLQTGEIEKVGSSKEERVNVRIIAATNKELERAVKEKSFREDLYYRLNVFKIDLPPLRDRKEDTEILALHFLSNESAGMFISKATLQALIEYDWKGNVRELESVIKRAIILANSEERNLIQLSDLPKEIVKVRKYNFEDLVLESLRNKKFSHSSVTEIAKELGDVNRTMVSENFRGTVFKTLFENDFELEKVISTIADTDEQDVLDKVRSKIQTFILNIENDIKKSDEKDFEKFKKIFSSKYKNLPVKFHYYLDEFIKRKV